MEESEDGGASGVGEDLNVGTSAFAAGGAVGGECEAGLDVVFDLRKSHKLTELGCE